MTARRDEGFTLVELLVVVVVLGILAAIVVASVSGLTEQSQDAACATESRTVRTAVELLKAKQGDAAAVALLNTGGLAALVGTPGLLEDVPQNHTWNAATGKVDGSGDC